jgi:hypothetical protein
MSYWNYIGTLKNYYKVILFIIKIIRNFHIRSTLKNFNKHLNVVYA